MILSVVVKLDIRGACKSLNGRRRDRSDGDANNTSNAVLDKLLSMFREIGDVRNRHLSWQPGPARDSGANT